MDAYEAAWRQLLHELNKIWKKVELECKRHTAFNGWFGKYLSLRKSDTLLCYLHHARNSDEHTLTEITKRVPGDFGISAPPETGVLQIRSLKIDGGRIEYDGGPAVFHWRRPRVELLRVLDRGNWYELPTAHQDAPIASTDPVKLAELAIAFHSKLISDAEAKFL